VQQAERGEVQEELTLRLALGNQLLEAEEYELAAQVLGKLLQRQRLTDASHSDKARTLMSLGHAHRHAERTADTLDCWREAVAEFTSGGEYGEAARSLLAIGTLLSREDHDADAIVCFEAAVAAARKSSDDAAALPQALHALGHAMCEAGDQDGLTQLDEAIRLARDYGAHWYEADYSDTRARGLWALDHGPAAVSAALQAADLYSAADDAASAGNSELFAAHVLAELDRPADAVPMFRMVLAQPEVSRMLRVAANLGLSSALDSLGRKDEAEEARRAAEEAAEN
jgi:tetratricopeptide (TPR) repeat protein